MEEVAIMVPPMVNNDELSDETESINLDLHVSDTEDSTESIKKCDAEITNQTESEEDILNKYVDPMNGKRAISDDTKTLEELKDDNVQAPVVNGILEGDEVKDVEKRESYTKCNGEISPVEPMDVTENHAEDIEETLEKTEKNTDETLKKDEEKIDEVLKNDEEKLDEALEKDEEKLDEALNKDEEKLDEVLKNDEEKLDKALKNDKEKLDEALKNEEEKLDKALKNDEEKLDEALENDEEDIDMKLIDEEENVDEELKKDEDNVEERLVKGDENVEEKDDENIEETLLKDDESIEETLMKDDDTMEEALLKDDDTMEETLEEDEKMNVEETLLLEDDDDEDLQKSISNEKADQNLDDTLSKKEEDAVQKEKSSEEAVLEDIETKDVDMCESEKILSEESNEKTNSELKTSKDGDEQTSSNKATISDSDEKLSAVKDVISEKKAETEESDNTEDLLKIAETSDSKDDAKSETLPGSSEGTTTKETNETKTEDLEDNDDLLCVMDEKTVEEANDNKDENSCSASEKENEDDTKDTEDETKEVEDDAKVHDDETKDIETEDETKESEHEENHEETETKDDEEIEENGESHLEMDMDASECAMDIEESDIGGVVYTDQDRDLSSSLLSDTGSKIETDKDANKENEHSDSASSVGASTVEKAATENGLTNGVAPEDPKADDAIGIEEGEEKDTQKKSSKRQLSDSSLQGDSPKKIKLQTEEVEKPPPPEKRTIYLLNSFKKFMLDKKLKTLTRFELEELCMQKMCECIMNKSEIGELRQKILIQDEKIDTWRKEAVVVAKQTRDLKIVHERLMADLKTMKEQTGKPLVPVKITRSVGLQAIIENPTRMRSIPVVNGPTTPQRTTTVNQQNKTVPSPQTRTQVTKLKAPPQRVQVNRTLQPITQKDNTNNAKPRQIVSSPQQNKKNADPKAVIDLTDEDEKNQSAKTTNTASPTVRILNKQNMNNNTKQTVNTPNSQASKIMFVSPNVLQRNSAVMVKMNSNGIVSPQNGLTTIPNGQVSVVSTPVVRTVSQVRVPVSNVTTVRATAPAKQIFKHPAPLPAAPNYQTNITGKKPIPPKPHLNLTRSNCGTGIVLQWKMPYKLDSYETIVSYQLYAYQETKSPPKTDNWGKIGDVKALELPMAVTLTQFAVGNRYFFAVRAVDGQKRLGPFSDPENILL